MKWLMTFWLTISVWLTYEFIVLDRSPNKSLLNWAGKQFLHLQENVNMLPGRSVNYYLGWIGFGLMVVMNIYMLRKRMNFMRGWGSLRSWLNFHIFCGLMGPTLILFHCGFKVKGLVGISFWSMVISASSGVIGRYFYGQISRTKNDLLKEAGEVKKKLVAKLDAAVQGNVEQINKYERLILAYVGGAGEVESLLGVMFRSLAGDIRLLISKPPSFRAINPSLRGRWVQYGLLMRKAKLIEGFEALMGYWHIFHTPFAIFMYLAAFVHVVSSLIFQIK